MKIGTRLTVWYASIVSITVLVIGALSYYELVIEPTLPNKEVDDGDEGLGDVGRIILWCGLPAVVLAIGGGWFLMRRTLRPITRLADAMERIHERNLGETLPLSGSGDEIDRLTELFNGMTARLADSFQRTRDFALHASHELKTPLTIMRGELENAIEHDPLTERQRAQFASQLDEVHRLSTIVEGLTFLTKADAGLITLVREEIDLAVLVRDAAEDAQILADSAGVEVRLQECAAAVVIGDRHRLRQVLLNLVDNGVKYNVAGGFLDLSLVSRGGFAEITIANSGPGIPAAARERVFDPFYRCEETHDRKVEGCGLGLSMVHWIVQAHGGTIRATERAGGVTVFVVSLRTIQTGGQRGQFPATIRDARGEDRKVGAEERGFGDGLD